jgi:predicted metal-dependent hydrolase
MKVENRDIKYPRIEFRTGNIHFILPMNMEYHPIMDKYEDWIMEKQHEINKALKHADNIILHSRNHEDVKKLVTKLIDEYSDEYGIVINRVAFRNLISKWGSCSSQGNLTFNRILSYLPDHHFRYVVFHELMHLIERKHTPKYWSLVSEKFPDYKEIEKELLSYWFLINKKGKG